MTATKIDDDDDNNNNADADDNKVNILTLRHEILIRLNRNNEINHFNQIFSWLRNYMKTDDEGSEKYFEVEH